MKDLKTIIDLRGVICKDDDSEITEVEYTEIMDGLMDFLDLTGFKFNGGWILQTEEENLKDEK